MTYPFTKCLHPKKLVNPYTRETIVVPCGACEACLLQKSAKNTLKCKLESYSCKYTEFVTLTYDDVYVPTALIKPVKTDVIDYLPISNECDEDFPVVGKKLHSIYDYYHYELIDNSGRFDTDGLVLGDCWMRDIDMFAIRKKVGYGDVINVLRYEDIQLFIKRLREKIFRLYGQKIRYFVSGEYGPQHYRPHWHILLFYDCPFLAQGIGQVIHSCWSYGRVDSSKSRGKCSQYTAGYVNGNSKLPAFYQCSKTKPKSYHSIRLGEAFCQVSKKEVYASKDFGFVKQCVLLDNVSTTFNMWRSFTTRLFPRCKAYIISSFEERIEAYRIKKYADKSFGTNIPLKRIAKRIVNDIQHYSSNGVFRPRYYNDEDYKYLLDFFLNRNSLSLETVFGSAVDKIRLLNSIYAELLISKHFLEQICDSFDYSECVAKLHVIDSFYKSIEYDNLLRQLQWQSDNVTVDMSLKDYRFAYSEVSSYYFEESYVLDDNDLYDNKFYLVYRESTLKNYNRTNKYKKLNDTYNVRRDN